MDDMLIQAKTPELCNLHAQITILVFMALSWEINWEKSVLVPTQNVTHLNFDIHSKSMTATLPLPKIDWLVDAAQVALLKGTITVHDYGRLMGLMQ